MSKKADNAVFVAAYIASIIGVAAASAGVTGYLQHKRDVKDTAVLLVNCTAAGMMIGELFAGISDGTMDGPYPAAVLKREVDYLENCGPDDAISARMSAEVKDEVGTNPDLKKFAKPGASVQR